MADIDLKTATPDTTLPTTGFLFGADSQAAASPSVFTVQSVATTLLGSTTLTGATVTADSPVLNLAQTWNSGAVTFTGLKFNATDTASAAGSLLMDLQVGGVSQFRIDKTGLIEAVTSLRFRPIGGNTFSIDNAALTLGNDAREIRFGAGSDLRIGRRAAANLRLGAADAAAPAAQTLSVQSVVAGTSNTAGANLTIAGSQGTGTGAGGSIVFQVAPAGSSGTAQNALADALTITSGKIVTAASGLAVGDTAGNGLLISSSSIFLLGVGSLNWRSGGIGTGADLALARDAANTLALRYGANGQTFNAYGTYTDASNYRRVALAMTTAGVATLKPEGAGTGASGNVIHISGLPTSNPGPGILWNNAGTPAIGT